MVLYIFFLFLFKFYFFWTIYINRRYSWEGKCSRPYLLYLFIPSHRRIHTHTWGHITIHVYGRLPFPSYGYGDRPFYHFGHNITNVIQANQTTLRNTIRSTAFFFISSCWSINKFILRNTRNSFQYYHNEKISEKILSNVLNRTHKWKLIVQTDSLK